MKREIFGPDECRTLLPELSELDKPFMVYRYSDEEHGWELSIATAGRPGSGALSLGGFRIAPESRTSIEGFDSRAEALGLGAGMEEKVYWSRHLGLAGPSGKRELHRIVGGKCVLKPSSNSRVGQEKDIACLEFALEGLLDFEKHSGVFLCTGQDLGHGQLSNGESSLNYLNARYKGCVIADTSKPTAAGNFYCIQGIAEALGKPMSELRVALFGFGNIGHFLGSMLKAESASVSVLDLSKQSLRDAEQFGFDAFPVSERKQLLAAPVDLMAFNAAGGSLDRETINALCSNAELKAVTGCENLALADESDEQLFHQSSKLFTPTEYCGMYGYLTAIEQYFRDDLDVMEMVESAKAISESARRAASASISDTFSKSFREYL